MAEPGDGTWAGFVPRLADGAAYLFGIDGLATEASNAIRTHASSVLGRNSRRATASFVTRTHIPGMTLIGGSREPTT
jgi:hypothetical protein